MKMVGASWNWQKHHVDVGYFIYFTEKPNQTYIKKNFRIMAWWFILHILLLRRLRQDNSKVVASPGYIEKPCLEEAKVKRSEES